MTNNILRLNNPPIVEAVLDIDCDLPSNTNFADLEQPAREKLHEDYPDFQARFEQNFTMQSEPNIAPTVTASADLSAYLFLNSSKNQIVQIRKQGYSFYRLKPYTGLDDYLPEIERTWKIFVDIAKPTIIRAIRLRYINRIFLPLLDGRSDLSGFLRHCPQLPDTDTLTFNGFSHQHLMVENETGNQAVVVLASQPEENNQLPVILDNTAASTRTLESEDWNSIADTISQLRTLKNLVFERTLTEKCLQRYN